MARSFGIDQRSAPPSLRPEQGRSYFLGRLLKDVIFGEAMLVSARPRRRSAATCPCAPAPPRSRCSWHWAVRPPLVQTRRGKPGSDRRIRRRPRRLQQDRAVAAARPGDRAATCRVAPLLDQARALPFGVDARTAADAVVSGPVADQPSSAPARARSTATRWSASCCRACSGRLEAQMRAHLEPAGVPLRGDPRLSDARLAPVRSTATW